MVYNINKEVGEMGKLRIVIAESNSRVVKRLFKHKIFSIDNLKKRPLNRSFISVYPTHALDIASKIVNRVAKGENIVIATDDIFLILAIDMLVKRHNPLCVNVEYVNYNTCVMTKDVKEAISDMTNHLNIFIHELIGWNKHYSNGNSLRMFNQFSYSYG